MLKSKNSFKLCALFELLQDYESITIVVSNRNKIWVTIRVRTLFNDFSFLLEDIVTFVVV